MNGHPDKADEGGGDVCAALRRSLVRASCVIALTKLFPGMADGLPAQHPLPCCSTAIPSLRSVQALVVTPHGGDALATAQQSASSRARARSEFSESSLLLKEVEDDLKAGRLRSAEVKAWEAVRAFPDVALAWFHLGTAAARLGETDEAIQAFQHASDLDKENPQPYFNLGLLYAGKSDVSHALESYRQGLALDSQNSNAFYNYGRLLIRGGQYEEAVRAFKRTLQLSPKDQDAQLALLEAFLRSKQRGEAKERARSILERNQTNVPTLIALGRLLAASPERHLARTVFDRALAIAPNSPDVHLELSRLQTSMGNYDAAVAEGRRAAELAPQSLDAHLVVAEALIAARRHQQAEELLVNLQRRFDNSAEFHYTLGIAEYGERHYHDAIRDFEKASQINPQMDLAQFFLGTIYYNLGDLNQAAGHYQAAVSINPRNWLYYSYLGRIYERQGREFLEQAVQYARQALTLNPKDLDSKLVLASWEVSKGNLPGAKNMLEEIVGERPGMVRARVALSRVYYRLKMANEAEEQVRIIHELESKEEERRQLPLPQ